MAAWIPPSEAEVARYFLRLNNWGRCAAPGHGQHRLAL
jgi:hypothetical protein